MRKSADKSNGADAWGGLPVSRVYQLAYENIKKRIEERGEEFKHDKAVRILAEIHTDKLKDMIDENMTEYDQRKLTAIVERCVARYIKLE